MTRPTMIALLVACWGCSSGGYGHKLQSASYAAAPAARFHEVEESAGGISYDRADYDFAAEETDGEFMAPSGQAKTSSGLWPSQPATQGASATLDTGSREDGGEAKAAEPPGSMVVYTGYLKLRVKRLLDAIDEIERITAERGGYIESCASDVVVLRVPASDFDEVLAVFAGVGELLGRRIKALDVSEQFTDIGARLAVAKEARARLLKLLERVQDVDERLLILREVKRLSELIESSESTLATLRNLVDYFTITIELVPIMEGRKVEAHGSPFAWVRALAAHRATIHDGRNEFTLELPPVFVLFDKDDSYRAQAADTTVIRGGVVDNEPQGGSAFWADAVHFEMISRGEIPEDQGLSGAMRYRVYRSDDVTSRLYLVAVAARGDDLFVLEVFYPDQQSFAAHHQAVVDALATFEVR